MQEDSAPPIDPGASSGLDELLGCLEHYQAAVLEHEDALAAMPNSDAKRRVLSLAAADAVTAARIQLYRCLVADGWRPPSVIADAMEVDEVIGHLATGGIGG